MCQCTGEWLPLSIETQHLLAILLLPTFQAYNVVLDCCRNGIPVDIARAVQRYSISSAVCVPVRLTAVISDGDVVASERLLGTLTLASCGRDAVTPQ